MRWGLLVWWSFDFNQPLFCRENDQSVGVTKVPQREPENVISNHDQVIEYFWQVAGKDEIDWVKLQKILDYAMKRGEIPEVEKKEFRGVESSIPGTTTVTEDNNLLTTLLSLLCGAICKDTPLADFLPKAEETPLMSPQGPCESQSSSFSKDVCRSLIALLDRNRSGKLGLEEFKLLWADIRHWTGVFQQFDKDRTSSLNGFELREAINSAGFSVNNHILNMIAHRYGNRNGTISYDDFLLCIIRLKRMIELYKEKDADNNNEAKFSMDEFIEHTLYS